VELENLNLDRVAAVLERADLYLGNDSGISHLAGIVRARGVVVFGASDSATWRPLGDGLVVASARPNCHSCGTERLCTHRLSVASVCELLVHRRCVPCRTPLCGA
jgi:ADP-heptose:LPS heptosyltransferase